MTIRMMWTRFIVFQDNAFMMPEETLDLTFDKPFIFIIRDADTNEVWFIGTVYEPKVKSAAQ